MSVVTYAYSNTRVKVMRSLLLSEGEFGALTRVKSLDDFVMSLKQTYYGDVLSGLDTVDVHKVGMCLGMDLIRAVNKVFMLCPPKCRPLFDVISRKYEFELIKLILNSQAGGLTSDEIDSSLPFADAGSVFRVDTEEFISRLSTLSVEEIISAVLGRYSGLDKFMPDSPDLLGVLVALDQYYFSELQNAVGHLKGADKKTASMLVALEIEVANIMILLRAVSRGYDDSRFIIPSDGYHLGSLDRYLAVDAAATLKKLSSTVYGPILEDAADKYEKTNSLLPIELALKAYLAKQSQNIMIEHPFRLGFILGYMTLKELEIQNLKSICVGIAGTLPSEKIEETLVMLA